MSFKPFKKLMQDSFTKLVKGEPTLFLVDVTKDSLWEAYLESFKDPDEKQTHNCNCCRQFIKSYGGVVTIKDGQLQTIWDFTPELEYQPAVDALKALVLGAPIRSIFVSDMARLGTDSNIQLLEDSSTKTWEHLFFILPNSYVNTRSASREQIVGENRDVKNVFKRSLDELTIDASQTVLELISQNSLYRGQEFKNVVSDFLNQQRAYAATPFKDNFCWYNSKKLSLATLKIRNSAIGTLLTDISEGKELDKAVEAFERMVAPTNYKRPTPIVTKGMVEEAEKAIAELGLADSLERRFATPEDISTSELLYVNRDTKKAMGVFEEMKESGPINPKSLTKIEEVTAEVFMKDILPTTTNLEVLFENSHMNNLMSVITAKNPTAPSLFKWRNPFSWFYTNTVTDSIKEKVKAAGGNVDGELRFSLSWHNYDDLDIHVREPNGNIIFFGNYRKPNITPTTGQLDVDMNVGAGTTRTPVENIVFTDKNKMLEGTYEVLVHQYQKRENSNVGFSIEVECNGVVFNFDHEKSPLTKVSVAKVNYSRKDGISVVGQEGSSSSKVVSKEKWGLETNKFQKVSIVMNSPNHWNGEIGNKHLFFIVEGAKNTEPVRGFFNEFLTEDLMKNRRVFELLGSKLAVEPADRQLSGLGFSTTQRNHVICRVEGKFKRTIKVVF